MDTLEAEKERLQSQLQQSQSELEYLQVQLQHSHLELQQAQATISAMQTSKFWKLRTAWFNLKNKILGITEPQSAPPVAAAEVTSDGEHVTQSTPPVTAAEVTSDGEHVTQSAPPVTAAEVTSDGERVTHLYPNDCYYAHLSIYYFALQFSVGKLALDAGSGAGYGSAYLAEQGAHFVWGIDVNAEAVAFSQYYFPRPNLQFQVMDLQKISGFQSHSLDLVFSSNALEHIPDVLAFFRTTWQLLKPEGVMIVAVPPITNDELRAANLANPYHLNIWSPSQWYHVLNLYFAEIECYRHGFEKPGVTLDFGNTPAQTVINEKDLKDFVIEPVSFEQLLCTHTMTAIFVARQPRAKEQLPLPDSPLTFVDDSLTRPPVLS